MPLPESITQGVTTGHLAHHDELHAAQGGLDTTVQANQTGHLSDHSALKTWAQAAGETVPEVTDAASHELAHEALHAWRNSLGGTSLTTEGGSVLTTEDGNTLVTEAA